MDEELQRYEAGDEFDDSGSRYKADQVDAWLSKCRKMSKLEARLRELAEQQFAMADGLKALDYSKSKVQSSPTPDAIPNAVADHMEMGQTFEEVAANAAARQAEAKSAILALDDPDEVNALLGFYVQGLTWEQLSVDMNHSYSTMMRIRKRGLVNIYDRDLIPHTERDPRHPAM